jgi:hypothetical protein
MKRIVDEVYFKYSAFSAAQGEGILVRCPKCQKQGVVIKTDEVYHFNCLACGDRQSRSQYEYRYDVHNQCKGCGRYYRVDITDKSKQHFSALHVACPYCGVTMSGAVQKTAEQWYSLGEIKDGIAPFFGYPLYFQGSFDNKRIWAINRAHLQYLIDYLEADLREKPRADFAVQKTQADHLPTFMKLAKNRGGIVKALKKMQEEG